MDWTRLLQHLTTSPNAAKKLFSDADLLKIEKTIQRSEQHHLGQIVFVVEGSLSPLDIWRGIDAKARARDMFLHSNCWDTAHNSGVLIYLLVAERNFEIVADRGIHPHVTAEGWETICQKMEHAFRAGHFVEGVLQGIETVTSYLELHYPRTDATRGNEVSDKPIVL